MNLEEELTKMLDENGIAVPPGTAVNPDRALDMLLAQNQAGRRARSASRTPPNPQARMRALSQGTLPNRPIVPGNQGPQSPQTIAPVQSSSRNTRRASRCDDKSGRVRSKSKSSKPYKSRLVMKGDALDPDKTLDFMLEQKQQVLAEQARNQMLVDETTRTLHQNQLLSAQYQQAGAERDAVIQSYAQAEVLMENQRQSYENQIVQASQHFEAERASTQSEVQSLISAFDQHKQEIVLTAESVHAAKLAEMQKLFDHKLLEVQATSRQQFEHYKALEDAKNQQEKLHLDKIKKEHAQQAAALTAQGVTISNLEARLAILNQQAVTQVQDNQKLALKLNEEESTSLVHLTEFEDERKKTAKELVNLKLENAQMAAQMDLLNEELRKARIANPNHRSASVGAKRSSVQIGDIETFEISTPRDIDNEAQSPGGEEFYSPGGDTVDSTETGEDGPEDGEYYETDDYEYEEETQENQENRTYTDEEWAAWRAYWYPNQNQNNPSDVPNQVASVIRAENDRKSECLVPSLEFQKWPSFGDSAGWRFNTKEKWAKATADSVGLLDMLAKVEQAESWEEITEPEKFVKVNRLAYDALWAILNKRLHAELVSIKGKLMNPTEPGAPIKFLNASQIYWFILREFKRPGALIGQQNFRDLTAIKMSACEGLLDFQRKWDTCLTNFAEKPTAAEFKRFDIADIYRDEVCKDKPFKEHLTIYRTSIEASLITPCYEELHKIVDNYLAFQDNERRRVQAEKAMEKKIANANLPPGYNQNYAFVALPTDSKKPKKGDCFEHFYTGHCQRRQHCPWNHHNRLPDNELRKGKGKGNKQPKKGNGKGDKGGKGGKGGKGDKGKGGKGGKGDKGKGKGGKDNRDPSREPSRARSRDVNRNENGQPTRGKSPSGEPCARLCKNIKAGKCQAGNNCRFWHPGPCRAYKQGTCQLGNKCMFMHPNGTALIAQGTAEPKPKAKAKAKIKAAEKKAKDAQDRASKAQSEAAAARKEVEAAKSQGD